MTPSFPTRRSSYLVGRRGRTLRRRPRCETEPDREQDCRGDAIVHATAPSRFESPMRRSPLFYVGSIRRTPRACEPPHPSYQRGFVQARDDFVEHRRPFILTELEARRDRANDRAKADHLRALRRLAITHFPACPRRE